MQNVRDRYLKLYLCFIHKTLQEIKTCYVLLTAYDIMLHSYLNNVLCYSYTAPSQQNITAIIASVLRKYYKWITNAKTQKN